jgi:hypothetical protein
VESETRQKNVVGVFKFYFNFFIFFVFCFLVFIDYDKIEFGLIQITEYGLLTKYWKNFLLESSLEKIALRISFLT